MAGTFPAWSKGITWTSFDKDGKIKRQVTEATNQVTAATNNALGKELDASAARFEASSARMNQEMDSQLDRFSAMGDQMMKVNELAKALAEKRERERVAPNGEVSRDYWKTQIATLFDDDMDDADLEDLLPF